MKVTAIVPDELMNDVQKISGGKNTTESLIIALQHYVSTKRMYDVIEEIEKEPFTFREDFIAYGIRKNNRNR
ncbi:MAG: DUF2191 domain-containing protein [Bacteroidota bacterium]